MYCGRSKKVVPSLVPVALPDWRRRLIVARAAALGTETLAVLEAAAVVGREFDAGLLARVMRNPAQRAGPLLRAPELDDERLAEVLDGAERAALIVPAAGSPGRFALTGARWPRLP